MARPAPTDEELATRAGRGDEDAFEELVRQYSARMMGFLRSCRIPADNAEDLAQDIWVKVWRNLPRWTPGHFRGWLFTVARRKAQDAQPVLARLARGVPLADAAEPAANPLDRGGGADPGVVGRLPGCLEALRKQKPDYHAVFVGHTGGKLYHELAAEMGVELGTIKSRLNRARDSLRKCLLRESGEVEKV